MTPIKAKGIKIIASNGRAIELTTDEVEEWVDKLSDGLTATL